MANEHEEQVRRGQSIPESRVIEEEKPDLLSKLSEMDPQHALAVVGDFARANPHVALGGGVLVGFLLGGGLTPRILGAVGLLAARRYLRQTINETLEGVLHEEVMHRRGTP